MVTGVLRRVRAKIEFNEGTVVRWQTDAEGKEMKFCWEQNDSAELKGNVKWLRWIL